MKLALTLLAAWLLFSLPLGIVVGKLLSLAENEDSRW